MNSQCINNVNCVTQNQPSARDGTARLGRKLAELLNTVQIKLKLRREQRISRDAMAHLIDLDDVTLKDIGLTRGDVIWASRLPLSTNAALELKLIADQRRKQRSW